MAVGRPVVLIAQGEAAEIVRKHHAGVVVAPGDIDGLLKSIEVLYKSPDLCAEYGTNGRLAVENEFNRKKIVEEFVEKESCQCRSDPFCPPLERSAGESSSLG